MLKAIKKKLRLLRLRSKEPYSVYYRILGFIPDDLSIYEQAFLHRSSSIKTEKGKWINNERLEFLGDAVLDAVVADVVFHEFESKKEGFLTNTRSKIVQRETLNKLAVELGLDKLVVSATRTSSHNNYMYGNAFEAFIGAIYIDQGYDVCKKFIEEKVIKQFLNLNQIAHKEVNFKSKLIEWSQKNKVAVDFELIESFTDNDNNPVFQTQIIVCGIAAGIGTGYSKKESQQNAAKATMKRINSDSEFKLALEEAQNNLSNCTIDSNGDEQICPLSDEEINQNFNSIELIDALEESTNEESPIPEIEYEPNVDSIENFSASEIPDENSLSEDIINEELIDVPSNEDVDDNDYAKDDVEAIILDEKQIEVQSQDVVDDKEAAKDDDEAIILDEKQIEVQSQDVVDDNDSVKDDDEAIILDEKQIEVQSQDVVDDKEAAKDDDEAIILDEKQIEVQSQDVVDDNDSVKDDDEAIILDEKQIEVQSQDVVDDKEAAKDDDEAIILDEKQIEVQSQDVVDDKEAAKDDDETIILDENPIKNSNKVNADYSDSIEPENEKKELFSESVILSESDNAISIDSDINQTNDKNETAIEIGDTSSDNKPIRIKGSVNDEDELSTKSLAKSPRKSSKNNQIIFPSLFDEPSFNDDDDK